MTREEIIKAVAHNKGGMFTVQVDRPAKLKKAFENTDLRVHSSMQLQKAGYGRIKAVREAVESGEREAPQLPKWINPATVRVEHGLRFGQHWNGTEYLMQPLFDGNKTTKFFVLNGEKIQLDYIKDMVLSDEYREKPSKQDLAKKGQAPCVSIKLTNISQAH
jgi:hypothetical protein